MKKIVIISDGLFTKDELIDPGVKELFSKLDQYDVSYDVAVDTTAQRSNGKPQEFVMRIEREGPEWIEPDQEVMDKIKDAEVIVTHFSGVNSKMINSASQLKLIGVMRSGVENVSLPAAKAKGITVVNCPGRVAEPVADFTVGLLLAEVRNIVRLGAALAHGDWGGFDKLDSAVTTLRNHTAGIIGFGIIGKKVATRLTAFGAKLIAYDPYCTNEEAAKYNVELLPLEELLKKSDYVLMHARLSEETKNLMGEKEFALMKPTAIFINTARAGLVDEAALIKALQEKKIRSAALDVFSQEPLPPDHPLIKLGNVTLTPHRAGGTIDIKFTTLAIMVDQLKAYFSGEPLVNAAK
jgi:D-3-phosphoglycerate dehydrogenase / 2-oxoglutarate reductase